LKRLTVNYQKMNQSEEINGDVLSLQRGCIYGPVKSRRLKSSLGINLLPVDYKLCSFNCIYCQYGLTEQRYHVSGPVDFDHLPTVNDVSKALLSALSSTDEEIRYITFSGNGEATLHPEFPAMVDLIMEVRDRYLPTAKTAILSNSTGLINESVRSAIQKLDTPIMKLDAGDEPLFRKINHPANPITFEQIVDGLKSLQHPGLIIQALMLGGKNTNADDENIRKWAEILKAIKPSEVHIYSLDRPPALKTIKNIPFERLREIAGKATSLSGVNVVAF